MTSKGLTDAMKHNILFGLKSNKKVMILITIFHLLAFPLIILSCIYNCYSGYDTTPDDLYGGIAVFTTFAAAISGIVIAMNNFRYLYNKSQVDMHLSLPMTKRQKFISDYVSGLMAYVLPFLAVSIITWLLLLFCNLTMEGQTFMMYNSYDERVIPEVCEFFTDFTPVFGYCFIVGILAMIMLYTLTLLVMVCCGTLFESITYTIMINAVIPLSILLTFLICFNDLHGINCEDKAVMLIGWTSPVGAIVQLIYLIENISYENYGTFTCVPLHIWIIGFIICTAAMLIGAYFLYMKRKAEHVSKPFVFKGFYYILITLSCLSLASFIGEEAGGDLSAVVIISFIFYMTLEVISRRGFKKIWHGILRYAATLICLFVTIGAVQATGCFGLEKRVPSVSSVAKVYIGSSGMDNNGVSDTFRYFNGSEEKARNALNSICITDPENIELIVNAHRETANIQDSYDSHTDSGNLSICYILKNGTRMVRYYSSLPYEALEYIKDIEISDEYKAQKAEYIGAYVSQLYDRYKEQNSPEYSLDYDTGIYMRSDHPYNRSISVRVTYPANISSLKGDISYYPDREFFTALGTALENDIKNMPSDQILRSSADCEFILDLYYKDFRINSNYTETMAVLAQYGYTYNLDDEELQENLLKVDPEHNLNLSIIMYHPGQYKEMFDSEVTRLYGSPSYAHNANCNYVVYYSDELAELYKIMKPVYIADELCYTMEVDGRLYAIPNEYRETAGKLYSQTVTRSEYDSYDSCLYRGIAY
ncbi:MAG: hypothetical protein IJ007_05930 [Oscillospiraceae bacterium]|nr:hypothetical protein [Oscillospiraceae bacterium]